jgi:predicted metal-binding protein
MNDIAKVIEQLALAAGATHAHARLTTGLRAEEEVRQNCLVNYCGKSNKSWTCPPHTGDLEALGARLLTYTDCVVLQSISNLEDSWDFEGMADAAHSHNSMVRSLAEEITKKFPNLEILPFACGSCDYCEKCTCPDEPCRFPDNAMSSVEAQGLDINALIKSVGLKYINGLDTVSYVGMILWREKK